MQVILLYFKYLNINFGKAMKKIVTTLILTFFSVFIDSQSQQISYLLPDIGAPGMITYLEIIGSKNFEGNYGPDNFYANNPGDYVRVELVNPSDSDKIIIGPVAVSWNGKMISTHFFVMPWVTPNSDNWMLLRPEFRIPVRVKLGSNYSNIDTFFIVQPFVFGDKSGSGERVLGDGSLGMRSKRGGMIVSDMKLAGATYTVSTKDCDPYTSGNQGYLPFVLMVKGKIDATSVATISLDGNVPNGGAGGGGGGGKFCDGSLINPLVGDNGGDGFTGGGHGGRNGSGVSNVYKNVGNGTGNGGASLNGVAGGTAEWYEASGGGTGHPFGFSGYGCSSGPSCDPEGMFGGGSGFRDDQDGGAGGYGSNGKNTSSKNGGKIYGNAMLVPLAGGSGGASGNPHSIHECSGNGGGGGGAIRIFAQKADNISITANGANGSNSSYSSAKGGSGSAGAIELGVKTGIFTNLLTAANSTGGGGGRIRFDSPDPLNSTVNYNSGGGSFFRGISTDTNYIVKSKFNLKFTKSNVSNLTHSYYRPLHGSWTQSVSVTLNPPTANGFFPMDLKGKDSLFLFIAYQRSDNPNLTEYTYEPVYMLSQMAANFFKVDTYPLIVGDSVINIRVYDCLNKSVTKNCMVYNHGDGDLTMDFDKAYFDHAIPGLTLATPRTSATIPPNDSTKIFVNYTSSGFARGPLTDTLIIPHNDFRSNHNPWKIFIRIDIDTISFNSYSIDLTKTIDTIDFGKVCMGSSKQLDFAVKNYSTFSIAMLQPLFADKSSFISWYPGKQIVPTVDTTTASIVFTPQTLGKITTLLFIRINECSDFVDTIVVTGEGVLSNLHFVSGHNFNDVSVGNKDTAEISLVNDGNGDVYIQDIEKLVAPFKIVSTKPKVPYLLKKGDTIKIRVEYTPTQETLDSTWIKVLTSENINTCLDSAKVQINGHGTKAQVLISLDSVDFGVFAWCGVSKDTAIIVKNGGSGTFHVLSEPVITGKDTSHFLIAQNLSSWTFTPGKIDTIWVKFIGIRGQDGPKVAYLEIPTDDPSSPLIKVKLVALQEGLMIDINPPTYDFGNVPIGKPVTKGFLLTNRGKLRRHLNFISSSNTTDFSVNPLVADLTPNGGTANIIVTFKPTTLGILSSLLTFYYDTPCPDTQYVNVKGIGLEGFVGYNDSVFFGSLAPCETTIDSVSYINKGQAMVQLDTMYIQGPDATMFNFVSPMGYPFLLDTNETFTRKIRFAPTPNTPNGLKTAELVAQFFMNATVKTYKTKLTGIRMVPFSPDPDFLDFQNVIINSTSNLNVRVTNIGPRQFTIINTRSKYIGLEYNIAPLPAGITINPGGFQDFNISFTPTKEQVYPDTLKFIVRYTGCVDTSRIYLTGTGIPPRNIILTLPESVVMPNLDKYHIPYTAQLEKNDDTLAGVVLNASIEFNSMLYYPTSVMNGKIISNTVKNGIRTLKIETDTLKLTGTKTMIGEMVGYTALGDADSTILKWSEVVWNLPAYIGKTDTIHGKLKTIICREGGDRLVKRANPIAFTMVPNPSDNELIITGNVIESGTHVFEIVNTQGQSFELKRWNVPVGENKEFSFKFDLRNYSSGVYNIILRTPERTKIERLFIIK